MSARFETTQWSRVLTARDGADAEAREALEALCQTYWHPLYVFTRRQGLDPEGAADLTQAFFADLLERRFLDGIDPAAGRFRSFLLASLKHFLSHQRERERAQKRGGGTRTLSLDTDTAEARLAEEPDRRRSPDEVFERRWALTVLDRALARLRLGCRDSGSASQFDRLKPFLTGDAGATRYREVAADLGMEEGAVRTAVHRLRKRFGAALRAEISHTLADPGEVDDEVRHLLSVLGSSR